MIPPAGTVRWCEACQKNEALLEVTEQLKDLTWIHHWCIECAKLRVVEGIDSDLQDVVYFNE